MKSAHDEKILLEYGELRIATGEPDLDALETAIFLEDAFGLVLSEDEIDAAVLGDSASLGRFLDRKREVS